MFVFVFVFVFATPAGDDEDEDDDVDDDEDNVDDNNDVAATFLSFIPVDSENSFCGDAECFSVCFCSFCWICSFWCEFCLL